jgi:hypothetical protein
MMICTYACSRALQRSRFDAGRIFYGKSVSTLPENALAAMRGRLLGVILMVVEKASYLSHELGRLLQVADGTGVFEKFSLDLLGESGPGTLGFAPLPRERDRLAPTPARFDRHWLPAILCLRPERYSPAPGRGTPCFRRVNARSRRDPHTRLPSRGIAAP